MKILLLIMAFSLGLNAAEPVNCYVESNLQDKEHLKNKCLVELATNCYLQVRKRDPLKKGQIVNPQIDVSGSVKVFFTNNPNAKGSANCQEIPTKLNAAILNGNIKAYNGKFWEEDLGETHYNPNAKKGESSKTVQMEFSDWECARSALNPSDPSGQPNDFVVVRGPESDSSRKVTVDGVPTKYRKYDATCVIFE